MNNIETAFELIVELDALKNSNASVIENLGDRLRKIEAHDPDAVADARREFKVAKFWSAPVYPNQHNDC